MSSKPIKRQPVNKFTPLLRHRDTWVVTLIAFVALLIWDIAHFYPTLPETLTLGLVLPVAEPHRNEPIVATGVMRKGDFLIVTYGEGNTAMFTYDSWGRTLSSPVISFQPGRRMKLELQLPSVATAGIAGTIANGEIRMRLEGLELMHQEVPFHRCPADQIFFGENPVGGATLGAGFRGRITTADETEVRGRPDALISLPARLTAWVQSRGWHLVPIFLASIGLAWGGSRLAKPRAQSPNPTESWAGAALKTHAWFLGVAALNVLVFVWLMTGGTFRFLYPDAFGSFFDFQAQSLLQLRLDVPQEALGGEAFLFEGKYYGYFGLAPALLHLPFVLLDLGFGCLTRGFMTAGFLACLAAAYGILGHATRLGGGPDARPSPWAVVLSVTSAGIASTLLFLGSRVYTYHETILWGVAFAAWSSYFSLRYLQESRARWWSGAWLCGIMAAHSRATTGLFALGLLGWVALSHLAANYRDRKTRSASLTVAALAVAGFLSLNFAAYLKFHTTSPTPYQYHVQYSPQRLAKFGNQNFHLENVPHNLDAYVLHPSFHREALFPFFAFNLQARDYPQAKIDLEEPIAAIPFSMAGLVALAFAGAWSVLSVARFRRPLLMISLASLPFVACMLMFIATSHRYTADFCPPLICAAAFGLVWLDRQVGGKRILAAGVATIAVIFSFTLTTALTLNYQADLAWGVPEEIRNNVLRLREHLSPRADSNR